MSACCLQLPANNVHFFRYGMHLDYALQNASCFANFLRDSDQLLDGREGTRYATAIWQPVGF